MLKGIFNNLVRWAQNILVVTIAAGGYISINGKRLYVLNTAITANSTPTTAPAGSFAVTTHATGLNSIFRSDGSAWQHLVTS